MEDATESSGPSSPSDAASSSDPSSPSHAAVDDSRHGYPPARAAFYHQRTVADRRPDVDFYVEAARDADGPVLELACGTGRIYLPLLDVGVDADGFDRSAAALAVLRRTAADLGLEPSVWQSDMAAFAVDRAYDLAICPFNAFQHLLTVDDQLAALERTHDALAPGGRLIFDVFVPRFAFICVTYGDWQIEQVEYRDEPHEFRTLTEVVDEVEQVIAVRNQLRDPDGDVVFDERHRMKLLPKREVEHLARQSPFADWRVTSNFGEAPLEDGDAVQVWTLAKE